MNGFGFVYILSNYAMPGVYLLGWSSGSPAQVAKLLSISPASPHDYEVAYYAEMESPEIQIERVSEKLKSARFCPDRGFYGARLIDLIAEIEGDGLCESSWDSDMATEARFPGRVGGSKPLWFEQCLHSPGYIERLKRGIE